jgi:tetratricopeptide (TPR) repeat protein
MENTLNLDEVQLFNDRGIHFIKNNQVEEAIKYLDKAIDKDKLFLDAYYNKAIAYLSVEDFEKALQCYNDILEIDPSQGVAYYQKGNIILFIKDDYEEAMELYNKAIFLGEKNSNLFNNIALCNEKKGNIDQAIGWNDKAIKLAPENIIFLNKKAELLAIIGKFKESLEVYDSVLMKDVVNEEANHFKAILLAQQEEYEAALEFLDTAEELSSNSLLLKFDRVLIYEKLGEIEKAIAAIKVCESLDAKNIEVLKKKAEVFFLDSNIDEALEVYDYIIELYPDNYEALFSKANVLMLKKRFLEASKIYSDIIVSSKDDNSYKINSYYYRALALKSSDSSYIEAYEEAIKKYTNLALYYQYDFNIYMLKANSYRDIGKNIEAEEYYEFAIDLNPNFAEIYLMRAKNRIYSDKVAEAKKDIDKALALNNNYRQLIELDEDLKRCFEL